jgi:hypothetical protein
MVTYKTLKYSFPQSLPIHKIDSDLSLNTMYKRNPNKDLLGAALTASLGAGIVTSFAISQGQHPLIALTITAIAAICGVICRQVDLI